MRLRERDLGLRSGEEEQGLERYEHEIRKREGSSLIQVKEIVLDCGVLYFWARVYLFMTWAENYLVAGPGNFVWLEEVY